jgi:CAAX protease family protein
VTVRSIFVGADNLIRPPWRILLFFVALAAAGALSQLILQSLGLVLSDGRMGSLAIVGGIVVTINLVLAHAVMLRWVDRRSWSFVGLGREEAKPRLWVLGWILGAAPIAVVALALIAFGWLDVVRAPDGSWINAALRMSLVLLPAALLEELVTRGYLFQTLREWGGAPVAIFVTSVGFGLLHLSNPGWTVLSISLVALAGVYLGVILLLTRSLYAVWMTHWAWNWVMAVLLHIEVSGNRIPSPDYKTIETGPDWLTGGPWGPEGGVPAGAAMLISLALLYRFGIPRKNDAEQR